MGVVDRATVVGVKAIVAFARAAQRVGQATEGDNE